MQFLRYVVSKAADAVNGERFDALTWDASAPQAVAARRNGRPAGLVLHPSVKPRSRRDERRAGCHAMDRGRRRSAIAT